MAWFGAVQAQEYPSAKWGIALRLPPGATDHTLDRAFDEGAILRTHVMRPTWHFVARADLRWMLQLTAPRVHRVISHYCRRLGLDSATRTRAASIFERALDRPLTRTELAAHLERGGIAAKGIPLAMLTIHAELEGVICSGPRRERHMTYARVADRAPGSQPFDRDEALAELTKRYFQSHGPATIRDFVWWSGLTSADAKRGLEIDRATPEEVDGRTYWTIDSGVRRRASAAEPAIHLLPIYDEYLVAYRDRDAVPHGPGIVRSALGRAMRFQHALVIGGQVAGTWRIAQSADSVSLEVAAVRRVTRIEKTRLEQVVKRYGRFVDAAVSLSVA